MEKTDQEIEATLKYIMWQMETTNQQLELGHIGRKAWVTLMKQHTVERITLQDEQLKRAVTKWREQRDKDYEQLMMF